MIVVITDQAQTRRPLFDVAMAAIAGGAARVVLRDKHMEDVQRRVLADRLRAELGDRLVVAGTDPLGGTALHLPASAPPASDLRCPAQDAGGSRTPRWFVGRSCHSAAELARLTIEDYVTLSPVFPSASKPGHGPALTPAGAAALNSPGPWLALGGVDSPERAADCAAAGAAGVAVMGAVMRAADPARAVAGLLAAFDAARLAGPVREAR